MKRIFSFVLSALLAVVFTTAHAQQNIFIWKGGNISVKSVANINSITSAGSWLFDISISDAEFVTNTTLEASVSMSYADNVQSLPQAPEVGVCFSSEKANPTYADEHRYLGNSVKDYSLRLIDLDPGTTYYYRAYVKLGDDVCYGNVKSIMTKGVKPILINGHKFIDLGLSSGLLWASTNIGAASSRAYGDYFAWGETEPKSRYDGSTYKWWGDYEKTKYNTTDRKTTLDTEDDAATVNWGAPCRMPSFSEFKELCSECKWYFDSNGYEVTGPNGNVIFLPASGYCFGEKYYYDIKDIRLYGFYWSRTLNWRDPDCAKGITFNYHNRGADPQEEFGRVCGYSVRPVAEK